jgi:hypothetical protein
MNYFKFENIYCSFLNSNHNIVGLGLFGISIMFPFVLKKNKKTVRFVEYPTKMLYDLDVKNLLDEDVIKLANIIDEPYEIFSPNYKINQQVDSNNQVKIKPVEPLELVEPVKPVEPLEPINTVNQVVNQVINEIVDKIDTDNNKQTEQNSAIEITNTVEQTDKSNCLENDNSKKNESKELEESVGYKRAKYIGTIEKNFLDENSDEMVIKIICGDDEKICWKTESHVTNLLSKTRGKNINLIVETMGSSISNVLPISNCLHIYKKLNPDNKVKIHVPRYSYSSGSIIALMADELYLNDYAFLSPVDTQLGIDIEVFSINDYIEYSADENGKTMDITKNSLMLSIISKKYDNLSKFIFSKYIFNGDTKYSPKKRKKIMDKFLHTELPHVAIFDKEEIEKTGIKIKGNVPENIMSIYHDTFQIK